jgi:hypothetical protein
MTNKGRMLMTCPDCGWRARVPEAWMPEGEVKKLRDALREIAQGRLPEDYGIDWVAVRRMSDIARAALIEETG